MQNKTEETIPEIFQQDLIADQADLTEMDQKGAAVINRLRADYIRSLQSILRQLERLLADIRAVDPIRKQDLLQGAFFRMAHDIKGQGETFGYPVLTALGADMCERIGHRSELTADELQWLDQDISDMKTVASFPPNTVNQEILRIRARLKEEA